MRRSYLLPALRRTLPLRLWPIWLAGGLSLLLLLTMRGEPLGRSAPRDVIMAGVLGGMAISLVFAAAAWREDKAAGSWLDTARVMLAVLAFGALTGLVVPRTVVVLSASASSVESELPLLGLASEERSGRRGRKRTYHYFETLEPVAPFEKMRVRTSMNVLKDGWRAGDCLSLTWGQGRIGWPVILGHQPRKCSARRGAVAAGAARAGIAWAAGESVADWVWLVDDPAHGAVPRPALARALALLPRESSHRIGVLYRLEWDGRVETVKLMEGSGNAAVDAAIINAYKAPPGSFRPVQQVGPALPQWHVARLTVAALPPTRPQIKGSRTA